MSDEEREEHNRLYALMLAASDAALAKAPADLPPIRDRDPSVGYRQVPSSLGYIFETDAGLKFATERGLTGWLLRSTREELAAHGYPKDMVEAFTLRFYTHEEIVRATGGDYYKFFK